MRGESKAALGGGLVKHRQPGNGAEEEEGTAPERQEQERQGPGVIRGLHGDRNGCTVRADRGLEGVRKSAGIRTGPVQRDSLWGAQSRSWNSK